MPGTYYPFVENVLSCSYSGGLALEIGAGAALYRPLFDKEIAVDLPNSSYIEKGAIDVFCDARTLPFTDQSFDFAFGISALHLIPQPEVALREVARVLKKGSDFLMFDIPLRQKKKNTYKKRARGDESFMALWTRSELCETALGSGFSCISPCCLPLYAKSISVFLSDFEPISAEWLVYRMTK